jgi:hypothetical protein
MTHQIQLPVRTQLLSSLEHTPPCGRLADRNRNRNRNVKPQLDNRNTENGIKIFWKIFHKIFTFFTWTPIRQH